jgi:LmbE family N-acetylglucosaminyl deacetylase
VTHVLAGAPLPGPEASRDLGAPRCVVAIGAHPDDIEFHCGATLARWSAAGAVVHLVICTDGSKGTWDTAADPAEVARHRAAEAADAASALGATGEVLLLGAVDGELAAACAPGAGGALHDELVGVLRRLRPDVVLGHDPWRRYRLHPDHRAAGFLTVDACVAARDPHFVPDRGPSHRPAWLLLFEADEPDHVEVTTPDALRTKVDALLAHRSQWRSTMAIDYADDGTAANAFAEGVTAAATEVGTAAGTGPAESFRRLAL